MTFASFSQRPARCKHLDNPAKINDQGTANPSREGDHSDHPVVEGEGVVGVATTMKKQRTTMAPSTGANGTTAM